MGVQSNIAGVVGVGAWKRDKNARIGLLPGGIGHVRRPRDALAGDREDMSDYRLFEEGVDGAAEGEDELIVEKGAFEGCDASSDELVASGGSSRASGAVVSLASGDGGNPTTDARWGR